MGANVGYDMWLFLRYYCLFIKELKNPEVYSEYFHYFLDIMKVTNSVRPLPEEEHNV